VRTLILPCFTGLLVGGCAGQQEVLPTETISFRTQVAPVIERSCAGCHAVGGSNARDAVYMDASGRATYANVRGGIALALREIESGHMPPRAGVAVSTEERLRIKAWVAQGSKDN